MTSSKGILDSLQLAAKQRNAHMDSMKALLDIKERHPILLALSKWLNKINSGVKTPEEIKEQNNKIFAAFIFLLDHDYLFYLTVTNQTELIKKFFELNKKKLPLDEEDLLAKIRKEYELALENHLLIQLHDSSIQKTSVATNLDRYYFLPQSQQSFEIYCYVERECELLKYEYRIEEVKAFRKVFNTEATALIKEVEELAELPQEIKDEVIDDLRQYLSEFEEELLEVEAILENHPLKEVLHTITPEMYVPLSTNPSISPPLPDNEYADNIDDIDLEEESLDVEAPIKSKQGVGIVDEALPMQENPLVDKLAPRSSALPVSNHSQPQDLDDVVSIDGLFEPKESTNPDQITVSSVSTTPISYPSPEVADVALLHKVSNLREKWENVGKAFINPETGRLRHDSLHHAYIRHKKSVTELDRMLENLRQKYVPAINHLEQEVTRAQKIAIDDLKVDLHRFAELLSLDELESDENQEKVNLYIRNLANLVVLLDNLSNSKEVQELLALHLKELEEMEPLFQKDLKSLAPQYQKIKEQIAKQITLKLPEPGVVINPEVLTQPTEDASPKPRYRKFVSHLATYHEQQRLFHPKKLSSISEEPLPVKAPLAKSEDSSTHVNMSSEMEMRLKNLIKTTQMFLTRCSSTAKNEGSDTSAFDAINNILNRIKQTDFKTVDLNDLSELAKRLDEQPSSISLHSFAANYTDLEVELRAQKPSIERNM